MTLLSASVTLGTSIGNLLAGTSADASGHHGAILVTIGAAVALLVSGSSSPPMPVAPPGGGSRPPRLSRSCRG
ncbi:hypothetical protein G7085_13980 [Tessaracoccus sp. HDW20]|uniref:hypothetical protein n=1 Tax=Tessaracoccus coleopterorum TaxID=2714950 RepID=UPI0018D33F8E|nr:hypothetical protein [Tessaracoccus coleopterorum]NHB85354.1 hypothetical protein [Tessaracoccus coleopterorum]